METGERKVLIEGGSDAHYVPTGHLVFAREATLWAVPFDLNELAVTGPEVPVLEGVRHAIWTGNSNNETGAAEFAFSQSGTLAYIGGSVSPRAKYQLVWVDRGGQVETGQTSAAVPGKIRITYTSPLLRCDSRWPAFCTGAGTTRGGTRRGLAASFSRQGERRPQLVRRTQATGADGGVTGPP